MQIKYRVVGANQEAIEAAAHRDAEAYFTNESDWVITSIEARPLLRRVSDWTVTTWEADVEAETL